MDVGGYFRGKRITVMGLGLLGRGLGDVRYLAEQGAELTVTDLKGEEALADSLASLADLSNIRFVLGEHRLEDFRGRDFVLKAAGVPKDSPYVAEAERNGIPVKMSASWFLELWDGPCVGVTGTRGKSTTTHMIHTIAKEAGIPTLLGGNVRGVSTLALLEEATTEHLAVMELDSWQLQGFGDARLSPDVAVFTTFMQDHMNYYCDDEAAYLADKANIFLYQDPEDTLVLGAQCAERIEGAYGERIRAHAITAGEHDFRADWSLRIPGAHNRYAAALATEAARALDIDDERIERALAAFPGVPGRLELVRSAGGVDFYNDTTATTPDATLAALDAMAESGRPVLVLAGGSDKGLPLEPLAEALGRAKRVSLLAGSGTDRLLELMPGAAAFATLEEAFEDARAHAAPGDAVLLSPGFASFGMFKNEYDRGDRFDALVDAL